MLSALQVFGHKLNCFNNADGSRKLKEHTHLEKPCTMSLQYHLSVFLVRYLRTWGVQTNLTPVSALKQIYHNHFQLHIFIVIPGLYSSLLCVIYLTQSLGAAVWKIKTVLVLLLMDYKEVL